MKYVLTSRCTFVLLCFLIAGGIPVSSAPDSSEEQVRDIIPEEDDVRNAINGGVEFLVNHQNSNGSINDTNKNGTAMTALSLMAMLAVGHQTTDQTPEGAAMRKALSFVLQEDRQEENGYFGKKDGSRMYGHGIVTLMLTEIMGMTADEQQNALIRKRARKAVELTLKSQNANRDNRHYGGWRYHPHANNADMSVTVWQLLSLRSAQNAGIEVPEESIDRAITYLENSFDENEGGFGYQPRKKEGKANNIRYACVSGGMLGMQLAGEYDADEVEAAAEWLREHEPEWGKRWFLYGSYYYAQSMYQIGGEHAAHARARIRRIMLEHQNENGSWRGDSKWEKKSRVYATCLAILALSVKYHFLPIYQR